MVSRVLLSALLLRPPPRAAVAVRSGWFRSPVRRLAVAASTIDQPRITSFFFELPDTPRHALRSMGCELAAPIQANCWRSSAEGLGAARGESVCLHAPTGSGKSLAMVLPALFNVVWAGPGDSGVVLILAPSRELATQHASLVGRLLGGLEQVTIVTSSTAGDESGLERLGEAIKSARCVVATPRELCGVLECDSSLYLTFASRVEAMVLDELDLLMPARKYSGARVTRWQDEGTHPTEALVKLVARRSAVRLQVLAGSATLDKVAKTKLERSLKSTSLAALKSQLPLRVVSHSPVESDDKAVVVAVDESTYSLTIKTKRDVATTPTVRTTLIPSSIAHAYVVLPNACTNDNVAEVLLTALHSARPKNALVFVCSSYGLKVRAINAFLRARGFRSAVLSDLLWPASARNRRRVAHKRLLRGESDDRHNRPAAGLAELARDASDEINLQMRSATADSPRLVVADEAVTRGLHLDAVDTVFILGRPANADTYLHLAGRTSRDPFSCKSRQDAPSAVEASNEKSEDAVGTVVTLLRPRDVTILHSWVAKLGAKELAELELPSPAAEHN